MNWNQTSLYRMLQLHFLLGIRWVLKVSAIPSELWEILLITVSHLQKITWNGGRKKDGQLVIPVGGKDEGRGSVKGTKEKRMTTWYRSINPWLSHHLSHCRHHLLDCKCSDVLLAVQYSTNDLGFGSWLWHCPWAIDLTSLRLALHL